MSLDLQCLFLEEAVLEDAPKLTALHMDVSKHLTEKYGMGDWTHKVTDKGVLYGMRTSMVFVMRYEGMILGTLSLATKKPWAIDVSYFTSAGKPLYLTDMAVAPTFQGKGIGRRCLEEAERITAEFPAQTIRLDAYDHEAGAGLFYEKCGYEERGRVVYRDTPLRYYELLV